MPMISQLPAAASAKPDDRIPISQNGTVHAISLGDLLQDTQPVIMTPSQTLLGRYSVGSGTPESVDIGSGLRLGEGVLTSFCDPSVMSSAMTLPNTGAVILAVDGNAQLLPLSGLRSLFTAGTNIKISQDGTISASVVAGTTTTAIAQLPAVASADVSDLLQVSRSGVDYSVPLNGLLNGIAIDSGDAAIATSDSDTLWVKQGGAAMSRQSFSAVWNWINSKTVAAVTPSIEVAANVVLTPTSHANRMLICVAPVTLTALISDLGLGFECEIFNMSGGTVSLAGDLSSPTGAISLPTGQMAQLRSIRSSAGNAVFCWISTPPSVATLPGMPTGLTVTAQNATSVLATWQQPSGVAPSNYTIFYRLLGAGTWSQVSGGQALTLVISGLAPASSYEVAVAAVNAAGTGPSTASVAVITPATSGTLGAPVSLTIGAVTATSVSLSWGAPVAAVAPTAYQTQYRVSGTSQCRMVQRPPPPR